MTTWLLLVGLLLPQAGGGAITGQIRQPDGSPVAGIRVGVAAVPPKGADTNGITVLNRVAQTDASGRYRLENVAAGEYYVVAGPFQSLTYYPGTLLPANAHTITVAPGTTIGDVNFAVLRFQSSTSAPPIAPVPNGTISGRVVTQSGRLPLFFPSLYVYTGKPTKAVVGPDGVKIRGSGTFGAKPVLKDGTFEFSLDDGEYTISLITSLGDPLTSADGYIVQSIVSGQTDLLKEKLNVTRGSKQTITITLAEAPQR